MIHFLERLIEFLESDLDDEMERQELLGLAEAYLVDEEVSIQEKKGMFDEY